MKIIQLYIPYYKLVITENDWIFKVFVKVSLNKQFAYSIEVSYKEQEFNNHICSIFGKSNKKDPEVTFFMDAINRLKISGREISLLRLLYTEIINDIYHKVAKPINF